MSREYGNCCPAVKAGRFVYEEVLIIRGLFQKKEIEDGFLNRRNAIIGVG